MKPISTYELAKKSERELVAMFTRAAREAAQDHQDQSQACAARNQINRALAARKVMRPAL